MVKSSEKLEKVGKSGPFRIHTDLNSFLKFWTKMAASGQFGCPKITFDNSSCHFRSISNFFFLNFFDKMAAGGHFGLDDNVSYRTRPKDIWMNNAFVKFEERSLNPSKVIALTTKL